MPNRHYEKIEKAIRYINENLKTQPSLDEIADAVNLSPFHFQRLFRQWAGITPKRFLQFLTLSHAKQLLKDSSVFDVSLEIGLSSQSRLHDHFVTLEAVTPGQFKNKGKDMTIEYGISQSPFGFAFIAVTERGICQLSFTNKDNYGDLLETLRYAWPKADIQENKLRIKSLSNKIFHTHNPSNEKFHLFVQGSNFQVKVWESLLRIPSGMAFSYKQVANSMEAPTASRAVANAIAKNPIAYLIPCHRVIRNTGFIGGYRWGGERKQAIIAWEAAKAQTNHNKLLTAKA
jgi:AraC family transcriptional regulator of adaptative response/methylated-DNA-[protein]-cysteine methyltransferase